MKKIFSPDILVSLALVVLLLTFLGGPELLMPTTLNSMALILLTVLFLFLTGLIFKETALDEREKLHKLEAGRLAYAVGVGVLTLGIVVQSFEYNIDPWLIYTLIMMIIAKIGSRIYAQMRR